MIRTSLLAVSTAALMTAPALAQDAAQNAEPVTVTMIGVSDIEKLDDVDRGGFARLAAAIKAEREANANVVEVLHTRHGTGTQISEVQIDISVETRGKAHQAALLERLQSAGYAPQVIEA